MRAFFASLSLPAVSEPLLLAYSRLRGLHDLPHGLNSTNTQQHALLRLHSNPTLLLVVSWIGLHTLLTTGDPPISIPGSATTISRTLTPEEALARLSSRVLRALHDLLERLKAKSIIEGAATEGSANEGDAVDLVVMILACRPLLASGQRRTARYLRRAFLALASADSCLGSLTRRHFARVSSPALPFALADLCMEVIFLKGFWLAAIGEVWDSLCLRQTRITLPGSASASTSMQFARGGLPLPLSSASPPSLSLPLDGLNVSLDLDSVTDIVPFTDSSPSPMQLLLQVDPAAVDKIWVTPDPNIVSAALAQPLIITGQYVTEAVRLGVAGSLGPVSAMGLDKFGYAVAVLLQQAHDLVSRANVLGTSMAELAVVSAPQETDGGSELLNGLAVERLALLTSCWQLLSALPVEMAACDLRGDLRGLSIASAVLLDDTMGVAWVHVVYLRFATLLLLAPGVSFVPASSHALTAGYILHSDLTEATRQAAIISAYAESFSSLLGLDSTREDQSTRLVFRPGMAKSRPLAPPFMQEMFQGVAVAFEHLCTWIIALPIDDSGVVGGAGASRSRILQDLITSREKCLSIADTL